MTHFYKKLKHLMSTEEVSQEDICEILGRSWCYVNTRMNGTAEWTMADVYSICDTLHIPYIEIPLYFPRGGIDKKGSKKHDNNIDSDIERVVINALRRLCADGMQDHGQAV